MGIVILVAVIALFALGVKYIGKPMVAYVERRRLEREAETELYRSMNVARARQAAADKILRESGEQP